jgi:ABC-2 type transport system ATP-binding protein
MPPALAISNLQKTYTSGVHALCDVNLTVDKGEIFALLGPNGAGKTTLISIVCGIVTPTSGSVLVEGRDIARDFRIVRSRIGLVPQELTTDQFETVWATVKFSRALFGCPANPGFLQQLLSDLSLAEKRKDRILTLSGGMKRRVMIAKALSHEPQILFLDEPTAGVDVELRRDMWNIVRRLRDQGVTIILTTHYIEEAEELADRIGVVNRGRLILVEEKRSLMQKLGKKQLILQLQQPLRRIPDELQGLPLSLHADGSELHFDFDGTQEHMSIPTLLRRLSDMGLAYKDLNTRQSSLEDIFVGLVSDEPQHALQERPG